MRANADDIRLRCNGTGSDVLVDDFYLPAGRHTRRQRGQPERGLSGAFVGSMFSSAQRKLQKLSETSD